ncbi:unnamed protein product [Microthlaspi erraticum]|uniref:Protein kinase domain-containing protein n=1 Tax=Microthlaspi erraticum TaxID=1685480 RepID=A0A6D2I669_9BRAS|nr:unnamed protein product [Microthlaspi erraticum]
MVDLELLQLNSHPSLVKLIGYGLERTMLFISHPKSLPWETRLKISIGAAQCLALLHSLKISRLYKGNLTASKILLDSGFNARVSYFGLEMLPDLTSRSYVSSYEDEPYAGKLDMARDLYSFGVILLETFTGLENHQLVVAKQAIRNDKEKIPEIIGPDLENSFLWKREDVCARL